MRIFVGVGVVLLALMPALGQTQLTPAEQAVEKRINSLRSMPDAVRAQETLKLALAVRQLPPGKGQALLAELLASHATEGDFGRDTLQQVTDTLVQALRAAPQPSDHGQPDFGYIELASLVRYEHMHAKLDEPWFAKAQAAMADDDAARQQAEFALPDLHGTTWSRKQLTGKVVLVNFWATWCQPCRKEMPDLEALSKQFAGQGLVILGISDDDEAKVRKYAADAHITYPVLLDRGSKVNQEYRLPGIPMSFLYDRTGRMVAVAPDMRTRAQLLAMLAQAGLR